MNYLPFLAILPMRFAVNCRGCGVRLVLKDQHVGRRVQCRCGAVMRMPTALPPKPNGQAPVSSIESTQPPVDFESIPVAQPFQVVPNTPAANPTRQSGGDSIPIARPVPSANDPNIQSRQPIADQKKRSTNEPMEIPDENILD